MKKFLLIILAISISMSGFSQGIVFEQGTWKEVLEKAKQANKPIFVDVYTTWCGPCKKMSRDIFPLKTVGDVYNSNFICYQIDAEKGEGVEFAKHYEVSSYPTFLFIKPDGTVSTRSLGSRPENEFLKLSDKVLAEMDDSKPIEVWDKEYSEKKNDKSFLEEYIKKRMEVGMSNISLFDEYLTSIPEKERISPTVVKLYETERTNIKVNSIAYKNLQKNSAELGKSLIPIDLYLYTGIMNTVKEAAKTKNNQLLDTAIMVYNQYPEIVKSLRKDEIYMDYYKKTGDTENYLKYAINHCNDHLMRIPIDTIIQQDLARKQKIEKEIEEGKYDKWDSTMIAQLRKMFAHMKSNSYCNKLNEVAWDVFLNVSDNNKLQNALGWSERSLQLSPENAEYLDTYANLLYKLGKKDEAIAKEEEALHLLKKEEVDLHNKFEKTILKMKAGEKTW